MTIKTSDLPLKERLQKELGNPQMRKAIANAQDLLNGKREAAFEELGDFEQWRDTAETIRSHVLENLDYYLNQFADKASAAGAHVYFAEDAAQATRYGLEILQKRKAVKAVKSKSMVTEEIGLNEMLEEAGIEVIETDLGEYLLQIDDHDKPSHIVVPALHKNRDHFRKVLAEKKGYKGDNVPENMTRFVRQLIRKEFLEADVGITGCNLAVAETGTVTLVTNEGNGRFVTTAPKTQVVFMGMERIVPTFAELDIIFSMLARSAVGAKLTSYMSLMTGPKGPEDKDGPEELHIIVVDNGRSRVLESKFREVLRCIRCGTCMLECPAYRHISGHGYGTLYPGPLGLALVPVLAGYDDYKEITKICSLCGACNEVCPVKIPLYEYIFEHRRFIAEEGNLTPAGEKILMGRYGDVIGSSTLYGLATKAARFSGLAPKVGPLKQWSVDRDLPKIPKTRFRDWFADREKNGGAK
ncbi:MAG: iron-sulfur cluster-binding protein [Desulfobulbaceae bacterium S3730MH12]|nr:MAG: iron-sulfur cluster-binding protein [Desulfobulbaceae bacterium S5133MH15]OEU56826.1 MAG: iron-sulfur cluster-binding protein [Desulfobulbaceae bacterium S3730MH12]OEU82536.1 MAG: iron-sulfur cluster-binding protein [Desulfobulbaceae bacterium C00003063]